MDHYQAIPTDFDPQIYRSNEHPHRKDDPRVPVIRVFGATETGQKVCAHVHGAFPYLYIEYNEGLSPNEVDAYIHRLRLSIDHALAVSYRRNVYDGKTAFVAHISIVKGTPFYGFNVGYKFLLKVYLLNPLNMTRLADLLRQGAVMKKAIQPYESHMQYLAQWMCDYNLYGCAYIDFGRYKFRSPVPDYLDMNSTTHQWHDRTIDESLISDPEMIPRQSHCSIEVDVCVQDILNRAEIRERSLHHDFVEKEARTGLEEKLVHSMAGLWRDETRRRKTRMGDMNPGSSPFPPEVLVSVSADPRNTQPGGWIHEREYAEKIAAIAREERQRSDGNDIDFRTFIKPRPFEDYIKTSLESVEDLYPNNLPVLHASEDSGPGERSTIRPNRDVGQEIEVDESRILSFGHEEVTYESDEELARELETSQRKKGDHVEELRRNGNIQDATCNNETRSDSVYHEDQLRDAPDPVNKYELGDPNSSAELEALGIRNANDYHHADEDVFAIPSDCVSDIETAMGRYERAQVSTEIGEHASKRRKIIHDEQVPPPMCDRVAEAEYRELSAQDVLSQDVGRAMDGRQISTTSVTKLLDPAAPTPDKGKASQSRLAKPLSQETLTANGLHRNRTLTFPVVKDSRDPHTIQRLSQKSSATIKSSQASGVKQSLGELSSDQRDALTTSLQSPSTRANSEGFDTTQSHLEKAASYVHDAFGLARQIRVECFGCSAPSTADLSPLSMQKLRIPLVLYQDAFYSNEIDVPDRAREYAGKEFRLESGTVQYLPEFDRTGTSAANYGEKPGVLLDKVAEEIAFRKRGMACKLLTWEFGASPPSPAEVRDWLDHQQEQPDDVDRSVQLTDKLRLSQIDGPTQQNRHGFKYSQKQQSTSVQHETQYMSIMSLELHVNTRGNLVPNPEQDEVQSIFWCVQSDDEDLDVNGINDGTHVGILTLSEKGGLARKISKQTAVEVEEETTELDLFNRMVDLVRSYDPDILTGYEVHGGSWGYMIERARCKYDFNLCDEFSRMKSQSHGRFGKESDRWGFDHTSTIRVTGRHMINIWRAMRGELNLLQYTMENVVFHLLHRRIPHFPFQDLTKWYKSDAPRDLAKVLDYYISRVQLDLEILEQNELVPRTSEQARLLGVDFFSVFSRGSQFKVESLMFRIAKPENFILISPSRKQVGQQNALECLPLVMEPQSAFYNSPLLVLDFQSLYPSVMIAYNYCYSTFLGRVVHWRGQNKMGFTDFQREERLLELLKDHINIAPNGMMYVKPTIRKSLLAKMLGEILETRVMVKSGMKVDKDDKTLQRLLNNRQLALKLIANVTYGYTSASFSGRMPCSEIADSIVQTGRETLEKAIALIHSVEKWGAEVVYGDTDSLFVYLKGRTKDEAFDIGTEIAQTITKMNPRPVKLKFEKVYFPCVLLAKKRYVGFKYESKQQAEADFDAKGIETVRRDGTPAEQKIEEKALKILFRTADLSQVKSYFQRQCSKIMQGKVSIQDFCFAKEVKLGSYSDKGPPPPGALISTRRMLEDPRAEPQYGERVPYVVITGAPGARLIDRCVAPDILLHNDHNELDAEYYISKNLIPPLERIFNLVGANVRQWYDEMPKFQRIRRIEGAQHLHRKELVVSKKTLESYMKSSSCLVCREKLEAELPICSDCLDHPETSLLTLQSMWKKAETKAAVLEKVCRSCTGLAFGEDVKCDSKDCSVFYTRTRHMAGLGNTRMMTEPVMKVLEAAQGSALDW